MRIAFTSAFAAAAAAATIAAFIHTGAAFAQTEQPKPQIQSLSHAIHAVNDLDATLAFYRDVFGLNGIRRISPTRPCRCLPTLRA